MNNSVKRSRSDNESNQQVKKQKIDDRVLDKFSLLVRMTQNRKTQLTIDHIKKVIEENPNSIHFIYTMNTILNSKQFTARLKQSGISGQKIIRISHGGITSKEFCKNPNLDLHLSSIHDVCNLFNNRNPKFQYFKDINIVIMCSNATRYDNIKTFITDTGIEDEKRISVYYDEIHSIIDTDNVRKEIEDLNSNPVINEIIGISATPEKVFRVRNKYWSHLKINKNCNFDTGIYCGTDDIEFITTTEKENKTILNDPMSYLTYVINKHHDILMPRNKVFIPGDVNTLSHDNIRKMIREKDQEAVIIVINGKTKEAASIQKVKKSEEPEDPDLELIIDCKEGQDVIKKPLGTSDKEVSEEISNFINEYKLNDRLIIVTGLLCVGQGQTFANAGYGYFTHGIIGHGTNCDKFSDPSMLYQLFGRMTGNHKTSNFIRPKVYCKESLEHIVKSYERRAKVCGLLYRDKIITKNDYKQFDKEIDIANKILVKINEANKIYSKLINEDKILMKDISKKEPSEIRYTITNYIKIINDAKEYNIEKYKRIYRFLTVLYKNSKVEQDQEPDDFSSKMIAKK
jgi:hypothetical protein